MPKTQSKLRDAIDLAFAPAQYLNLDGSAVIYERVKRVASYFNRPDYLSLGLLATFNTQVSPEMLYVNFATALVIPIIDSCFKFGISKNINTSIFDTEKNSGSNIDPVKTQTLKNTQNTGENGSLLTVMLPLLCAPPALMNGHITLDEACMVSINLLPLTITSFGYAWRSRQVLDENWSLCTHTPISKQSSANKSGSDFSDYVTSEKILPDIP